jgi:hypothetical protein
MSKTRIAMAAVALLAMAALSAQARGGPSAAGPSGGRSSTHISMAGSANTNGANSADRDKGLQRSSDRMSQQGSGHEKAAHAHSKKKQRLATKRAHNKNQ